jgi:dihydroorotate dehydrogenase electron transfer subunit
VSILENVPIARDTFRIRLDDPAMAAAIRPGQFLMIKPGLGHDPLLGRPFALYDVARDGRGNPVAIDVVYIVIGRGTTALSERASGDRVSVWGPLGNGFGAPPERDVVFVAGGIGQTPFLALAKWWTGRGSFGGNAWASGAISPTMLYGVRSSDLLAGVEDFRSAGVDVRVATDDGSVGHHGFVTELLAGRIASGERPSKIIACGPPPMLAAVARIAESHAIDCDVSLENHMACGFGACFSCVAPIRAEDGSTDLRRVCVEGPIFAASDVVF